MKNSFYKLLERFAVYFTITSFIICAFYFFESILASGNSFSRGFASFFTYGFICFQGILFLLVFNIFIREKKGAAVYVTFALIWLIITFLVFKILNNKAYLIFMLPLTLLHYIFTVTFNDYFFLYDMFIKEWKDFEGEELAQHLYKNNSYGLDLGEKVRSIKTMLYILAVIYCIFIILIKLNLRRMTFFCAILSIIFFISFLIFIFVTRIIYNKSLYGFLGNRTLIKYPRHYIKITSIVFIIAFIPSLFLSRNEAFFNIRFSTKDGISASVNKSQFSAPVLKSMGELKPEYENLEQLKRFNKEPSLFIKIMLIMLQGLFALASLYLVFLILIKPFFSREFTDFIKEHRLKKYFAELRSMFKNLFKRMFEKTKDEQYLTVNSRQFMEYMNNYTSKKSRKKTVELGRLSRQFLLLVKWSEKKNIRYTKNLSPVEFTRKIKDFMILNRYDDNKINQIMNAGNLFEKALFDKNMLSQEQEKDYISAIKNIISE
ncbi:MAG: hypothetical protein IKX23_02685 [Treponema sp.]|nr:hypothetical protein [Treponema sp.]